MKMHEKVALLAIALSVLGCPTQDEPEAPELTLTLSPIKKLDFSWTTVTGAEFYQLYEGDAPIGSDMTATSISLNVEGLLHQQLGLNYTVEACNQHGCSESIPVEIAGSLAEAVGYVKATKSDLADLFGSSVALSADGNTLAIAARGEDSHATGVGGDPSDNSTPEAGAVYVYVRDPMTREWDAQPTYIKASNSDGGDWYGSRVALSADGNTLAVGATREDSNAIGLVGNQADNSASESGAVYVYARNSATLEWGSQPTYIKAPNTDPEDEFGWSVALSADGNTLAIGSIYEDSNTTGIDGDQSDNSAEDAGAVYVYVRDPMTFDWSAAPTYVKASNTDAGFEFGYDVALSADGDTLAVGARGEGSAATGINGDQTDSSVPYAGAVYVYSRDPESQVWAPQPVYVKASNTDAPDSFGWSVALSADGNTLAVGAMFESSNTTDLDGDQTDNSAFGAGATYVYVRDPVSLEWTAQPVYVKASNTDAEDWFGYDVSLSGDGNVLAVGAAGEHGSVTGLGGEQNDDSAPHAGAVYVYMRDPTTLEWVPQSTYTKASNTDAEDGFGASVALSGSGDMLAVGAPGEGSSATGLDGDQTDNSVSYAGAVYLY